jgi:hypothetical protein
MEHKRPDPEWAFLSDRTDGKDTANWKQLRKEKARKVLEMLRHLTWRGFQDTQRSGEFEAAMDRSLGENGCWGLRFSPHGFIFDLRRKGGSLASQTTGQMAWLDLGAARSSERQTLARLGRSLALGC